jgi:hypothetical protein
VGGKRAAAFIAAALFVIEAVGGAQAGPPPDAASRAGKYLVSRQLDDGSWPSSSAQTADMVADYVVALVSAGVTGSPLTKAVAYVAENGPSDANRAPATARVILAAVAAGKDPRDFGNVDYVGRLGGYYNPTTGDYDTTTLGDALAILALSAAGAKVPDHAIGALQNRKCDDGGFSRTNCLFGTTIDASALVLSSLVAARVGSSDPVVADARAYIAYRQNADGGFGATGGAGTAAGPTGMAIAALGALGEKLDQPPWQKSPTANPWTALTALQDQSGGMKTDASASAPDDDATADALPGLADYALPIRPDSKHLTPEPKNEEPVAPGETTTSVAPTETTSAPRGRARSSERTTTTAAVGAVPEDGGKKEVGLAAPARTDNGGRSLAGLLPFIATLFGAGAVGIVLRRRART